MTKLQFFESNDLVFVDKPSGFSTHSPDEGHMGLCEIFEKELGQKLFVVHRLDKTTTGALCFAKTPEKAAQITQLFQNHQVRKKYLFLTAARSQKDSGTVQSLISKTGKSFSSDPTSDKPNSYTDFKRVKRNAFFELWEAHPRTGKPHQIRLHAADMGLPILGDTLYGGQDFPHLCLHAEILEIPGYSTWTCFPPPFFNRMGLLSDPEVVFILSAFDRRQRLYNFLNHRTECLRVLHSEARPEFQLRADIFGDVLWVYWYRDSAPTAKDLDRWQFVAGYTNRRLVIRKMQNRGEDPLSINEWKFPANIDTWAAAENLSKYEFRSSSGLSPGLFLDQRENRKWLASQAAGKRVLNLFSYTCGFSLVSALKEASSVTSVDLSLNFLEWGKKNFLLNSLLPERYEFFSQDAELFLQGSIKRKRTFDVIVLDPPSFSRSRERTFRLEKDFERLLKLVHSVLAKNGILLISINMEKWSEQDFLTRVRRALPKARLVPAHQGWDFELPQEEPKMKAVIVRV